ncbi:MAG: YSC84-related protein [Gammaproteobacteria bacterium]
MDVIYTPRRTTAGRLTCLSSWEISMPVPAGRLILPSRQRNIGINNEEADIMNTKHTMAGVLILLGFLCSPSAFAIDRENMNTEVTQTLRELYGLNPKYKQAAEDSVGMLIFPSVTKAGLGVAGEYGEGVLHIRGKESGYFKIVSASIGLTAGVVNRREVIMFMTQDALDRFLDKEEWKVGVDASIALAYQGASDEFDLGKGDKPIIGFIFSETGLMGDLSLEGSRITRIPD